MIRPNLVLGRAAGLALLTALPFAGAEAGPITFTAGPTSSSDGTLDASAVFSISAGQIDVTLKDLESNIVSAGQELSGITFVLREKPSSVSITGSSGNLIDAPSSASLGNLSTSSHWGAGLSGTFTITLETVGEFGAGGKPIDLIIGPGIASVNNSVGQHQPEVDQNGAIFSLDVAGIDVNTSITSATFLFGAGDNGDHQVVGTDPPPPVPEPSGIALLGSGLLGLGYTIRKRRTLQDTPSID
jgi:hypothetical protein